MLQFLFIILILIILIPLIFVFGLMMKVTNLFNHFSNPKGSGKTSRTGFNGSGSSRQQSSSSNYGNKSASNNPNKIFKEGQGEYVDFEEID